MDITIVMVAKGIASIITVLNETPTCSVVAGFS